MYEKPGTLDFPQHMRRLRMLRGMTLREAANAVGFRSVTGWFQLENGDRGPSLTVFLLIAQTYDIPYWQLAQWYLRTKYPNNKRRTRSLRKSRGLRTHSL